MMIFPHVLYRCPDCDHIYGSERADLPQITAHRQAAHPTGNYPQIEQDNDIDEE